MFDLHLMEAIGDLSVIWREILVFPLRARGWSSFLMNRFALRSCRRGHYTCIPSRWATDTMQSLQ